MVIFVLLVFDFVLELRLCLLDDLRLGGFRLGDLRLGSLRLANLHLGGLLVFVLAIFVLVVLELGLGGLRLDSEPAAPGF